MIISRRRLKMMLAEEYERARVETEERFYRREEIPHLTTEWYHSVKN